MNNKTCSADITRIDLLLPVNTWMLISHLCPHGHMHISSISLMGMQVRRNDFGCITRGLAGTGGLLINKLKSKL